GQKIGNKKEAFSGRLCRSISLGQEGARRMSSLAEIDPQLIEEAAKAALEHSKNSTDPKPLEDAIKWFRFLVERPGLESDVKARWNINLGTALARLGEREGSGPRLDEAVSAYRE